MPVENIPFLISSAWITDFVNFYRECPDWHYNREKCGTCSKVMSKTCPEKTAMVDPDARKTMFMVQAEGAARSWNNLEQKGISLLADEVGMGKTIQALATAAVLWRIKPFAKILVIAPNKQVASNWIIEYTNFIQSHYRFYDDIVKTHNDEQAVYPPIYCDNLFELVNNIKKEWGRLFIIKTSSFSHVLSSRAYTDNKMLFSGMNNRQENYEKAKIIGERLKKQIIDNVGEFDLVIIDEAHYFRNFDGNSLRVNTAKGFFGADGRTKKLSKRFMLMTATPNHSADYDINKIVKFFSNTYDAFSAQEILENIGLRRFRLLANKNKYEYREENVSPAKFNNSQPLSEMFFALYQKKLTEERYNAQSKSFLFGYLEGNEIIPNVNRMPLIISQGDFLSLSKKPNLNISNYYEKGDSDEYYLKSDRALDHPSEVKRRLEILDGIISYRKKYKERDDSDNGEIDNESVGVDFYKSRADSLILLETALKYYKIFNKEPEHPKYDLMTNKLSPKAEEYWKGSIRKHLVFVRRIPSVYELSSRVMNYYDNIFWNKIEDTLTILYGMKDITWTGIPDRLTFNKWIENKISGSTEEDDVVEEKSPSMLEDELVEDQDSRARSKILDYFIARPKAQRPADRFTHASRWRDRFLTETSIFSIFFQPGDNYSSLPYQSISIKSYRKNKKKVINYLSSIGQQRTKINSSPIMKEIFETLYQSNYEEVDDDPTNGPFNTIFTLLGSLWEKKNPDLFIKLSEYNKKPIDYEALAAFFKTGILFASGALIELYCWFIRVQADSSVKGLDLYHKYTELIEKELEGSLLEFRARDVVAHFDNYCKKTVGVFKNKELLSKKVYKDLYYLTPVQPACGEIKNREKYIRAFNSPFFPEIIVATSVMQEGVNLNYFCKNVYHYGIAYTTGDNEQRVGRIDRMFGLIDRELSSGQDIITGNGLLNIDYPYLARSYDEDQLIVYLGRKFENETKLDKCKLLKEGKEVNVEQLEPGDWGLFLNNSRNPRNSMEKLKDPYPGIEYVTSDSRDSLKLNQELDHGEFVNEIQNIVKRSIMRYGSCRIFNIWNRKQQNECLLMVDVEMKDKRKQPVRIDFKYSPQISGLLGETVYYLSLKTPLSKSVNEFVELFNDIWPSTFISRFPIVRICHDPDVSENSYFSVYAAVDLPIYRFNKKHEYLSEDEIFHAFRCLVEGADFLEKAILDARDLRWKDHRNFEIIEKKSQLGKLNDLNLSMDFKDIAIEKTGNELSTSDILILNHENPFIIREKRSRYRLTTRISYPRNDIHPEEEKLLLKWFEVGKESHFAKI